MAFENQQKEDEDTVVASQPDDIGNWWAIIYEDTDVGPELFTDEDTARTVFRERSISYHCHLFQQVEG